LPTTPCAFILNRPLQGAPAPPELSLSPRALLPPSMSSAAGAQGELDLQASAGNFKKQRSSLKTFESQTGRDSPDEISTSQPVVS
jgi:hypothetical protein